MPPRSEQNLTSPFPTPRSACSSYTIPSLPLSLWEKYASRSSLTDYTYIGNMQAGSVDLPTHYLYLALLLVSYPQEFLLSYSPLNTCPSDLYHYCWFQVNHNNTQQHLQWSDRLHQAMPTVFSDEKQQRLHYCLPTLSFEALVAGTPLQDLVQTCTRSEVSQDSCVGFSFCSFSS